MKRKLMKLEALRGFAALYVVASHLFDQECMIAGHNFSFLFKFGREAVMLFFILSGFVIQYAFDNSKDKSFQTYFKKRLFRIYIPLIMVFALNFILYLKFGRTHDYVTWKHFLGNLFMLQDVGFMKPHTICEPFLGNNPLWSLSYEWWFYMIYYFVHTYWSNKSFLIVSIIAVIATATYILYPFFLNRLLMYLIIWWAGVEMAKLHSKNIEITIPKIKFLFLVLALCLILITIHWYVNPSLKTVKLFQYLEFRHMAFSIIIIIAAIGWKKFHWFLFDRTLGLFTFIAPISYTIYISHYFLVILPEYSNNIHNKTLQTVLGLSLCILFSYIVEIKIYPYLMRRINPQ